MPGIADYIDFDFPVPFQNDGIYFEQGLQRSDGGTNKGAFGRSVRFLPDEEFEAILQAGFSHANTEVSILSGFEEE